MSQNNSSSGGCSLISIGILLTIVFVILKLTSVITWAWLWVLSPLWISVGLTFLIIGLVICFGIVVIAGAAIFRMLDK